VRCFAVPLLLLFHTFTGRSRPTRVAIAAALPVYLALRTALAAAQGLTTPLKGVGQLSIVLANVPRAPVGIWFALEGGWLLVALACVRAGAMSHSRNAIALLLAALLPVAAALIVGDLTRSAAYAFPATSAALALLQMASGLGVTRIRRWTALAAAISLAIPMSFR